MPHPRQWDGARRIRRHASYDRREPMIHIVSGHNAPYALMTQADAQAMGECTTELGDEASRQFAYDILADEWAIQSIVFDSSARDGAAGVSSLFLLSTTHALCALISDNEFDAMYRPATAPLRQTLTRRSLRDEAYARLDKHREEACRLIHVATGRPQPGPGGSDRAAALCTPRVCQAGARCVGQRGRS